MTLPLRKGWCPNLMTPMESGDGLLVRIKPTGGVLSATAARAIVAAAAEHGDGLIDLTNRANLQIRGLRADSVDAFAAIVLEHGLADGDPEIERRRNVMADPLGAADPAATLDSHALAAEIETMLADEPRFAALPSKFGFLVDGGSVLSLDGVRADIAVRARDGETHVTLDGDASVAVRAEDAVEIVRRLALAFLDLSREQRRMRDLVLAIGAEAICAAAELTPSGIEPRVAHAAPIGFTRYPGRDRGVFLTGLPLGRIAAATFARLADLTDIYADGRLRTTPWRAIALADVRDERSLAAELAALDLAVVREDPRLRIVACSGKPFCANAHVDTGAAARAFAPVARQFVHVSGCAKGCAHPDPAAVTLVGEAGGYAVIYDGRAGDPPRRRNLTLDQALLELRS